MPTTTTDAIAATFRAEIEAIAPRMEEQRTTALWRHTEVVGPVRNDARWFRFDWDGDGYVKGDLMGPGYAETRVTLTIFVDYGGVPRQRVKILAVDDWHQINDLLNLLKDDETGLRWVEQVDWSFVNDANSRPDENKARVALQYQVRYMKARARRT